MSPKVWFAEHYQARPFDDGTGRHGDMMPLLREFEPDELNWVFFSTSGIHGSYSSCDDAEEDLRMFETDRAKWADYNGLEDPDVPWSFSITTLVLQPRNVITVYGNAILRSRDDIALISLRAAQTLAAVASSQKGNLKR